MTPARTSATISSRASGPDTASSGDTTSATDIARTACCEAGRPGPAPPRTGRTSRRPGCPASTGAARCPPIGPVVQQRETPPDDGVADLADRHGARHRTRPAQPHQAVLPGELVDGGAAVHPRHAAPQRQGLGVAQQRADPAGDDQPLTERAVVGPHPGAAIPTSTPPAPWAAGATGPRPASGAPGIPRRRRARCRPGRRRSARGRHEPATRLPRRAPDRPRAGSARWRSPSRAPVPSRSARRRGPAGRPASPATAHRAPAR